MLVLLLAMPLLGTAQTNAPTPKPGIEWRGYDPEMKLSEDFAKAAVRAVVSIGNSNGSDAAKARVDAAMNDAEAAAQGDKLSPDSLTLAFLKSFAFGHQIHIEIAVMTGGFPEDIIAKDAPCVSAWKLALQKRSGNQPKECGG
jgi:hypothetical protein